MKRLALLGGGGHGKVVADAATAAGWQLIEFFDDAWPALEMNGHWPVVGDGAGLLERCDDYDGVLVSIGNCAVRWEKQVALSARGVRLVTICHPAAWVSPHAKIGAGSVVVGGAVVNIDAVIGDAAIINTGATVDHDCSLADAVHVTPGAHLLGNVTVGSQTWIGSGAVVKQGTRIGARVMVGAGAVVLKDVPDDVTVVGNPAAALPMHKAMQVC